MTLADNSDSANLIVVKQAIVRRIPLCIPEASHHWEINGVVDQRQQIPVAVSRCEVRCRNTQAKVHSFVFSYHAPMSQEPHRQCHHQLATLVSSSVGARPGRVTSDPS